MVLPHPHRPDHSFQNTTKLTKSSVSKVERQQGGAGDSGCHVRHGGCWSQVSSARPSLGFLVDNLRRHSRCDEWRWRKDHATARQAPQRGPRIRTASRISGKYRPGPVNSPPVSREPHHAAASFSGRLAEPQPFISHSRCALRCTRDGGGAQGPSNGLAARERRWCGPLGVVQLGRAEEFGELARRLEGDDRSVADVARWSAMLWSGTRLVGDLPSPERMGLGPSLSSLG